MQSNGRSVKGKNRPKRMAARARAQEKWLQSLKMSRNVGLSKMETGVCITKKPRWRISNATHSKQGITGYSSTGARPPSADFVRRGGCFSTFPPRQFRGCLVPGLARSWRYFWAAIADLQGPGIAALLQKDQNARGPKGLLRVWTDFASGWRDYVGGTCKSYVTDGTLACFLLFRRI